LRPTVVIDLSGVTMVVLSARLLLHEQLKLRMGRNRWWQVAGYEVALRMGICKVASLAFFWYLFKCIA
jgi:hypothetical protein